MLINITKFKSKLQKASKILNDQKSQIQQNLTTNNILQCPTFKKKISRHTKKQKNMTKKTREKSEAEIIVVIRLL